MKKIPKRLFGQFVKNTSIDASTFSYRHSLENIKAGSFSLVCENSEEAVAKVTICPVFSEYLEQIKEFLPYKCVHMEKSLSFSPENIFPVKGFILPKMTPITGEELFFKKMLTLCDKLKDIGNILKILHVFLHENENQWIDSLKTIIFNKYADISWHPSVRIEVLKHVKNSVLDVKFSAYSLKLSKIAAELQNSFDALAIADRQILLQKLRTAVFCYNWIDKFNKAFLLGEFEQVQVDLLVKCFKAVQNTQNQCKSVVFDFHKGNLMILQKGKYKGLMLLTDPLFDSAVLRVVRDSENCCVM